MGLEAAAPIICWVNVITEFSTRLETASFVTGTQHHVGPRKDVVKGQKWQLDKSMDEEFETDR